MTGYLLDWFAQSGIELPTGVSQRECIETAKPPDERVYRDLARVEMVVVHHSATASGNVVLFRVLHRVVFGWDDVGYHYVIGNGTYSGDGELEEGRPLGAMGAHAKGHNDRSIGVCLVGDFNSSRPSARQLETGKKLIADLINRFSLETGMVIPHNEVEGCSTECPGRNLSVDMLLEG
jgi:N-acetyl-anhydromuramyl-L-alanine amidase AmpD